MDTFNQKRRLGSVFVNRVFDAVAVGDMATRICSVSRAAAAPAVA